MNKLQTDSVDLVISRLRLALAQVVDTQHSLCRLSLFAIVRDISPASIWRITSQCFLNVIGMNVASPDLPNSSASAEPFHGNEKKACLIFS